jgi:hypothetical protein
MVKFRSAPKHLHHPGSPAKAFLPKHAGADASVVRRTMSFRHELQRPVAYHTALFTIASTWRLCVFLLLGAVCQFLASFAAGRQLLLALPELFTLGMFSRQGPTEEQLKSTSFTMIHDGYALKATDQTVAETAAVCLCHLIPVGDGTVRWFLRSLRLFLIISHLRGKLRSCLPLLP